MLIADPAGRPMDRPNATLAASKPSTRFVWDIAQLAMGLAAQIGTAGLRIERMINRGVTPSALAAAYNSLDELERLIPALRAELPPRPEDAA